MAEKIMIDIAEIKQLALRLFEVLESRGKTGIRVSTQQYWTVFAGNSFKIEQPSFVLGDVMDDLEDVRRELASQPEGDTIIWHASHHLAGLLQLIAHADLSNDLLGTSNGSTS